MVEVKEIISPDSARIFFVKYEAEKDIEKFVKKLTVKKSRMLEVKLGEVSNVKKWGFPSDKPNAGVVIFEASAGNHVGVAIFVNKSQLYNSALFKENKIIRVPVLDVGLHPNPSDPEKVLDLWDQVEPRYPKATGMKEKVRVGILSFKDPEDVNDIAKQWSTHPLLRVGNVIEHKIKGGTEPDLIILPVITKVQKPFHGKINIVIFINLSHIGMRLRNQEFFVAGSEKTEGMMKEIKGKKAPGRVIGIPCPVIDMPSFDKFIYKAATKGIKLSKKHEEEFLKKK